MTTTGWSSPEDEPGIYPPKPEGFGNRQAFCRRRKTHRFHLPRPTGPGGGRGCQRSHVHRLSRRKTRSCGGRSLLGRRERNLYQRRGGRIPGHGSSVAGPSRMDAEILGTPRESHRTLRAKKTASGAFRGVFCASLAAMACLDGSSERVSNEPAFAERSCPWSRPSGP